MRLPARFKRRLIPARGSNEDWWELERATFEDAPGGVLAPPRVARFALAAVSGGVDGLAAEMQPEGLGGRWRGEAMNAVGDLPAAWKDRAHAARPIVEAALAAKIGDDREVSVAAEIAVKRDLVWKSRSVAARAALARWGTQVMADGASRAKSPTRSSCGQGSVRASDGVGEAQGADYGARVAAAERDCVVARGYETEDSFTVRHRRGRRGQL